MLFVILTRLVFGIHFEIKIYQLRNRIEIKDYNNTPVVIRTVGSDNDR